MSFGFSNSLTGYRPKPVAAVPVTPVAFVQAATAGVFAGSPVDTATFTTPSGTHLALVAGCSVAVISSGTGTITNSSRLDMPGFSSQVLSQNGTYVTDGNTNSRVSTWYGLSPTAGRTGAYIRDTQTAGGAPDYFAATGAFFSGVDQTTPFDTAITASGYAPGVVTATVTVPTVVGDYVCAIVGITDINFGMSGSITSSTATILSSIQPTAGDGAFATALMGKVATTTSTVMSATVAASSGGDWTIQAFVIKAG